MRYLIFILLAVSCATVPQKKRVDSDPKEEIDAVYDKLSVLLDNASELEDENGWPVHKSCDSMLWTGKYCYAAPDSVDLTAAEDNLSEGRFFRRPTQDCWIEGRDKQESRSTWSRDMAMGLVICAYAQKNKEVLERHINLGHSVFPPFTEMGEPLADGRAIYTPALAGLFYKTSRLVGKDFGIIEMGNTYFKGLDDYKAHLQMLDIWHRGELTGKVSSIMTDRIREHADREPNNTFYQVMLAKYLTGDTTKATELCLDDRNKVGSYVRCEDNHCELVERIFACKILLDYMMANDTEEKGEK